MYFRQLTDPRAEDAKQSNSVTERSIADIVCGSDDQFGLLQLVYAYLEAIKCDQETVAVIGRYLDLIAARATGALLTGAQWQRDFVYNHPLYKQDSVISEPLCRALLEESNAILCGKEAPKLLPKDFFKCPMTSFENAYELTVAG